MKSRLVATVCFIFAAAAPLAAGQQPDGRETPLSAARDLYASARYDEALAVLNGIRPDDPPQRKSIEQYRSLCLLALGRGSEAETAIAAVVTADPLFQPSEADASPRVRAAFSDVRQRLLPELARAQYAEAKASFDRKDFAAAEGQFRQVLTLVDDPQTGGRLADLRVLAAGFLDLSAAALTPPPPPKKEEPPPPPPPVSPPVKKIYNGEDPGVVAPVTIRQDVPRVPVSILGRTRDRGLLDIVIDEQGRVTQITLRIAVHPVYDNLLVNAAREWKYRPATLNGTPVAYRKLIQITVAPS